MPTRYTIEDMAPLFAERDRDGLTIAELARRTGISRKTLHRWDRELSEHPAEPSFVEVEPADLQAKSLPGRAAVLRIRIGRATIELDGSDIEESVLDSVIRVVSVRC